LPFSGSGGIMMEKTSSGISILYNVNKNLGAASQQRTTPEKVLEKHGQAVSCSRSLHPKTSAARPPPAPWKKGTPALQITCYGKY
jgi:hypothetical protein